MNLIEHIKERGMMITFVARKAGVSTPTIYALQDPEKSPNVATVVAVAKVLGIRPSDIRKELAE